MSYKLGREDSYNSMSAEALDSYDMDVDAGDDGDGEEEEKGDGDLVLMQPSAEDAWSMPRAEAKGETTRRTSPGKAAKLVQQLNLSGLGALPQSSSMAMGASSFGTPARSAVLGEGNEYDEPNIQETDVLVVFDLPDGSMGENKFKLGQTVEFLKAFVEAEYGIPMSQQEMFIEGRRMLDPFSLLDFPETRGVDEIFVRVDGPMAAESKK